METKRSKGFWRRLFGGRRTPSAGLPRSLEGNLAPLSAGEEETSAGK